MRLHAVLVHGATVMRAGNETACSHASTSRKHCSLQLLLSRTLCIGYQSQFVRVVIQGIDDLAVNIKTHQSGTYKDDFCSSAVFLIM